VSRGRDRGQFVLLAAGVLVVALVPMLFAYLQLGYHADVATSPVDATELAQVDRVLDRAVHETAAPVPGRYAWEQRRAAVRHVRASLRSPLQSVNQSRLRAGTAIQVTYNATRAGEWARRRCPSGPDRQFGRCTATNGVVVQNRSDRSHVLAVAVDVLVVSERGRQRRTAVHRVWPAPAGR
jgi:hypothetical protein